MAEHRVTVIRQPILRGRSRVFSREALSTFSSVLKSPIVLITLSVPRDEKRHWRDFARMEGARSDYTAGKRRVIAHRCVQGGTGKRNQRA